MATKTPALSYLRVSGLGQVDGDGFERQRERIAAYASRYGFDVVEEFRDEGVSGTRELDDRPGLAAVLERLQANGVKVLLVESADRLARDLMVSEVIIDQLARLECRVITSAGVDLTAADQDPTRKLIRQVLGAVAEFEKSVLVLKLRAARSRIRRREGRCEGRKPYGTRPSEASALSRIRELRRKPKGAERLSCAAIAARLNSEGHATRQGRPWQPGTVHAILARLGSPAQ